ncbi:uncharacterized protein LOC131022950 [Salvia miltiorrhiza]|uniref:uncharacterized protein LOC131022950 n=1 Tax=Salvia miltiorrhiza TaxID=226208 RepID=UPI0025ABB7A8|nr:uncharacterized protein LOC131022950 [Salvia miltiorrhiza]
MYVEDSSSFYEVDDTADGVSKVCYSSVDDEYTCSCKLFTRKALLCRHIFFVMRNKKLTRIPDKYIDARWSKLSRVAAPLTEHLSIEKRFSGNNHLFLELCKSIGHVRGDSILKVQLFDDLKGLAEKYSKLGVPIDKSCKNDMFVEYYGSVRPTEVDVLPPSVVHTKGSGSGGRRKSTREKLVEQALKPKRKCKKCNRLANHDSRNCPGVDVAEE